MLSKKSDNPAIIDPKIADNLPIILLRLFPPDSELPVSGTFKYEVEPEGAEGAERPEEPEESS